MADPRHEAFVAIGKTILSGCNSSGEGTDWVELFPYKWNMKEMWMSQLCVRGLAGPVCEWSVLVRVKKSSSPE